LLIRDLRVIRADLLVFSPKRTRRSGMRRSRVDTAPDWEKILRGQSIRRRAAMLLYSLKRSFDFDPDADPIVQIYCLS
jgi:hypothetical protein